MELVEWVMTTGRIRCGFTCVQGGVSRQGYESLNLGFHVGDEEESVRENRERLSAEVKHLAWMNQVHGSHVSMAVEGRSAEGTDALIVTPDTASAAAVMVADCVPLLLADEHMPIGAAVHVGRAGLMAGIAEHVVKKMHSMGARQVKALIGPSICGKCYEVPDALRQEVEVLVPGSAAVTSWGTPSIDIPAGLTGQLLKTGVQIFEYAAPCTFENHRYFSHRRAGVEGGLTGRFAGIIEITHDTPA